MSESHMVNRIRFHVDVDIPDTAHERASEVADRVQERIGDSEWVRGLFRDAFAALSKETADV